MQQDLTKREKKLRYAKPWDAIIYFCGPMILIVIIQGIYNIIDKSMAQNFVPMNKSIINLTTSYAMAPYYMLFAAAGFFGFGSSIIYSIEYGKRNIKNMRQVIGNMVGLQITVAILISILLFFLMNPHFGSYLIKLELNSSSNKSNDIYFNSTWNYSRVFIYASPLLFLSYSFPTFLRTEGKVFVVLIMQIVSIPVNVLFSFIYADKLKLGMTGVMMGSMMAWIFNIIFSLIVIFGSKKSYSKFKLKDMKWKWWIIKQSFPSGTGSFFLSFANAIQFFISMILTAHLPGISLSDNEKLCQLVYSSMAPFFLIFTSVGIGLAQGSSTICAFAFGAKKYLRIKEVVVRIAILQFIWFTIVTIVILSLSKQMILIYHFPKQYVNSYHWKGALLFSTYFFTSFTYLCSGLYPSIRKTTQTVISSMLRSFLIYVPLAFIGFAVSIATNDNIYYFIFSGLTDLVCSTILIPMLYITWHKNKKNIVNYNDYYSS